MTWPPTPVESLDRLAGIVAELLEASDPCPAPGLAETQALACRDVVLLAMRGLAVDVSGRVPVTANPMIGWSAIRVRDALNLTPVHRPGFELVAALEPTGDPAAQMWQTAARLAVALERDRGRLRPEHLYDSVLTLAEICAVLPLLDDDLGVTTLVADPVGLGDDGMRLATAVRRSGATGALAPTLTTRGPAAPARLPARPHFQPLTGPLDITPATWQLAAAIDGRGPAITVAEVRVAARAIYEGNVLATAHGHGDDMLAAWARPLFSRAGGRIATLGPADRRVLEFAADIRRQALSGLEELGRRPPTTETGLAAREHRSRLLEASLAEWPAAATATMSAVRLSLLRAHGANNLYTPDQTVPAHDKGATGHLWQRLGPTDSVPGLRDLLAAGPGLDALTQARDTARSGARAAALTARPGPSTGGRR